MATGKVKWHPDPGGNCPKEADLQTGDLLFPRKPGLSGQAFGWGSHWASILEHPASAFHERLNAKIGTLLNNGGAAGFVKRLESGPAGGPQRWAGYAPDPTRLSPPHGQGETPPTYRSLLLDPDASMHPLSTTGMSALFGSFPGPDDPDFLVAMKAILDIALPGLIKDWLGMTVEEFVRHELSQFLIDSLTSPDVRLNFFVGHVGMVLREQDGRSVDPPHGKVFVIETNITDYAHYRVSIHPYVDASDPEPKSDSDAQDAKEAAHQMYGWVNRRCALGEYVWHARPQGIQANDWQNRLVQASKKQLGRPYGFFDHPQFGDDDRMYCAEFVFRAFCGVDPTYAERLQDRQTWGAMQAYLEASGQGKQKQLVEKIKQEQSFKDCKRFFVMPPALLWNSAALHRLANPGYAVREPYAVAFASPACDGA